MVSYQERVRKIIEEFGATPISEKLYKELEGVHITFRRRLWVSHRDFDVILKERDFWIVSGRGPSEKIHFAHLILFDTVKAMQEKFGVNVFIPVSDDEKFLFGKASLEKARKYAIENLKDILALGFDPKRTYILIDTYHMHPDFYKFTVQIAEKITGSMAKDTFGFTDSNNVGEFFYSAVQVGHILYPTLLTGKRVLVPIGLDQDPFIRLSRDIAPKLGLKKPATIHMGFIRGLRGEEKMSASRPETSLYLEDDETVKRKIWRTLTGGQPTIEEQRKYGGNPDVCVVFEYISLLEKDDKKIEKIRQECMEGRRICGECKEYLFKLIKEFYDRIRKNRERIRLEEFRVLSPEVIS